MSRYWHMHRFRLTFLFWFRHWVCPNQGDDSILRSYVCISWFSGLGRAFKRGIRTRGMRRRWTWLRIVFGIRSESTRRIRRLWSLVHIWIIMIVETKIVVIEVARRIVKAVCWEVTVATTVWACRWAVGWIVTDILIKRGLGVGWAFVSVVVRCRLLVKLACWRPIGRVGLDDGRLRSTLGQ